MGDLQLVGQQFGDSDKPHFCETRWRDGLTVNGIETWSSPYNMQAFRLRYSDGKWGKMYGNPNPDTHNNEEVLWDSDELVGKALNCCYVIYFWTY